jgi:hypothetical protein
MKALVYDGPRKVVVKDMPDARIGADPTRTKRIFSACDKSVGFCGTLADMKIALRESAGVEAAFEPATAEHEMFGTARRTPSPHAHLSRARFVKAVDATRSAAR